MKNFGSLIRAAVAGTLAFSSTEFGTDSVVLGRGVANQYYADLRCPTDSICLDALYKWQLQAARTIAGPSVRGRVGALIAQHTDATRKFVRSVELFVLRPIQDPVLRKASGAQYYLLSLSPRYDNDQSACPYAPARWASWCQSRR
jgi:hypothetical protein